MNTERHPFRWAGVWQTAGVLVVGVGVTGCQGPFPQSVFRPASQFAESLDDLFMLIFWLAVLVFLVVETALIYTIIRFRAKPGGPQPKHVHGNTALEIGWTLAPAFIIALIAVPTISAIWQEALNRPENPLEVEVIGHQWWWEYRYPELGIVTANEMHVPQGRPLQLNMTSVDVIHSFWVPRLAGKRDLILGRTNQLRFTPDSVGTFLGQCAEFCGDSHANMRTRITVQDSASFDQWVAAQRAAPAPLDSLSELARRGLEVYRSVRDPASNSCLACHAIQGVSGGALGPNLTHLASRATIAGGILENNADNLARWLRDPAAIKPGMGDLKKSGAVIGMPNVGLSEDEISALVAYLQTLR